MARKRRKLQSNNEEKKLKLKDPEPNSEEYVVDEIEKFHRNKDKILLDSTKDVEESDFTEDEEDEVLGIGESEDDADEKRSFKEDNDKKMESDSDGDDHDIDDDHDSSDSDDGLPNNKAWGKSKKAYYNADVQDDDVEASDEEAEMAAEEEELEAMSLQKRMAEKLDVSDFYSFDELNDGQVKDTSILLDSTKAVTRDLTKLSKREKLEILVKESPELLPMLDEYKEKLNEVRDVYHPLLLLSRSGKVTTDKGKLYIEAKHQLLLNYLVNLSFYFALKANKDHIKGHPILQVLVQHKQLLAEMESVDKRLAPEIERLLVENTNSKTELKKKEKAESPNETSLTNKEVTLKASEVTNEVDKKKKKKRTLHESNKTNENSTNMHPLEYYNMIKSQCERKRVRKLSVNAVDDEEHEEGDQEEGGDGKRSITYEMAKNKGLTRKRPKDLKNPRVKHKLKFKKAKLKHKGQVREVRHEIARYDGETTGIKASIARSTKIK